MFLALLSALLTAAVLQFAFGYIAALNISDGSIGAPLSAAFQTTFLYGLPFAIAAVLGLEVLRLRRLREHIALATVVAFAAAHLATRSEPLTSYVFTSGPLTPLGLLVTAMASAAAYWAIAGRQSGWRGDEVETHYNQARTAFHRASEQYGAVPLCVPCLAAWAGASALAFLLFAWISIDGLGLRDALVADAKREARSALNVSGHAWAQFDIDGARGALAGSAPDELEKRMAHDIIREALYAVTGFPGVVSAIDDKSIAQAPLPAVGEKLAEAQQAVQPEAAAPPVAEPPLAEPVPADVTRTTAAAEPDAAPVPSPPANERPTATDTSSVAQLEPSNGAIDAPDLASLTDNERAASPSPAEAHEQVAAVDAVAPSAEQVGASVPAPTRTCADQDVALVESSRILFAPQSFQLSASFQRELGRLASSIQSCAHQAVLVTGYADANADTLFNPALSLQRAEAVRDALVARGVSATRIVTKTIPAGYSGSTDESTDERRNFRLTSLKFIEGSELSRDVAQGPDERATNCESDLSEIMSQSIIHFPVASARVSDESAGLIGKLAQAIQTCGSVIVTVEGHTDKIGTPERNQQLSIARATAVRTALASAGADPTRLASRGFASTRPLAEEETAEAYALNRRIEFKVSGKFTTSQAGGP